MYNIRQLKENKYITITALKLMADGTIVHAGRHEKIILYHASTRMIECLETYGLWLVLSFPSPHSKKNSTLQMQTGDVMLLYTDGITEAREKNAQNASPGEHKMYGEERLIEVFRSCVELPVDEIKEMIIRSLNEEYIAHDDITIIVVKKIARGKIDSQ
jgi:serine phosphatase RsbU (regulator of sigma subunit)